MNAFRKLVVVLLVLVLTTLVAWPNFVNAESTFEQIKRTGTLRIPVLVGEEPYYHKDLKSGAWSGFCYELGKDLAKQLGVKLEVLETSSWGSSILDLGANKVDIAFSLNPTPQRALVMDFTSPLFYNTFIIVTRQGFRVNTWEELNNPKVKIAVDIGSSHEQLARRYCPKADIISLKTRDEVIMTVQAKRADALVCTVLLGLTAMKKNPELGNFIIPTPIISVPVNAGVRIEQDKRFRDFASIWADYNRNYGNTQEYMFNALKLVGIDPSSIPPGVRF